jgi:hypothetical protein
MVATHPVTYLLEAAVSAVKLGETADSRSESSGITTIPAGSSILVEGRCTIPGMIDVVWDGRAYALFSIDLEDRASPSTH